MRSKGSLPGIFPWSLDEALIENSCAFHVPVVIFGLNVQDLASSQQGNTQWRAAEWRLACGVATAASASFAADNRRPACRQPTCSGHSPPGSSKGCQRRLSQVRLMRTESWSRCATHLAFILTWAVAQAASPNSASVSTKRYQCANSGHTTCSHLDWFLILWMVRSLQNVGPEAGVAAGLQLRRRRRLARARCKAAAGRLAPWQPSLHPCASLRPSEQSHP